MKNYTYYYYDSLKQNVSSELHSQTSLAFTTDTWTSCATEGYLTLTVHFIDNLWQLRHYVLATIVVKDHHKGENLANEIKDIVRDFGLLYLSPELLPIIRQILSPCRHILIGLHIRFFAHTLQLSVKALLKIIEITNAAPAAS